MGTTVRNPGTVRFADCTLDLQTAELRCNGETVFSCRISLFKYSLPFSKPRDSWSPGKNSSRSYGPTAHSLISIRA